MILYRITKCIYAADLSGAGARLYGGRWNGVGKSMVYLAATPSLAVLEVLVHLSPTIFPGDFCIAEIEVPENSILTLTSEKLPANWQDISPPFELKKIGNAFISEQKYLLMKVPSVIVPEEFNYLLNPLHPQFKSVKVVSKKPFGFDKRLV